MIHERRRQHGTGDREVGHVDGRVEGDIACAALVQGESSEIVGAVNAETARIAGTVRGTISARELVILRTARIEGDVEYDALTIEQGAQVEGRFAGDAAKAPAPRPGAQVLDLGKDEEQRLTIAN